MVVDEYKKAGAGQDWEIGVNCIFCGGSYNGKIGRVKLSYYSSVQVRLLMDVTVLKYGKKLCTECDL